MGKKMFKLNPELKFLFTSLLLNDPFVTYILVKTFIEYEEIISESILGYIGFKDDNYELFLIHDNPEKLEFLRNKELSRNGKKFQIKSHIHTKQAVLEGVKNNDQYFQSLIKRVYILIDKDNFLTEIKKGEQWIDSLQ